MCLRKLFSIADITHSLFIVWDLVLSAARRWRDVFVTSVTASTKFGSMTAGTSIEVFSLGEMMQKYEKKETYCQDAEFNHSIIQQFDYGPQTPLDLPKQ